MSHIFVESERVVNASPEDVYEVLADYKGKRQQILTPNFLDYNVEKGGRGSGTVVRYRLHAARRERPYRMVVEEAVKGKLLTERDTNSSLVTTWKLSPVEDGKQTVVRVATEWQGGKGVGGFFERTFAPLGLRRIYNNMLSLLAQSVQSSDQGSGARSGVTANLRKYLLISGAVIVGAVIFSYIRKLSKSQ